MWLRDVGQILRGCAGDGRLEERACAVRVDHELGAIAVCRELRRIGSQSGFLAVCELQIKLTNTRRNFREDNNSGSLSLVRWPWNRRY